MRVKRNIVVLFALCTLLLPFVSIWFSGFQGNTPVSVTALPAPTIPPQILYYTEFADNTPGGEAENVWAVINATHGTDYLRTNLTSYTDATTELPNHDIFLIIEQELISPENITDIATAWQTPLNDFLADGGIVILTTFRSPTVGGYGATAQILNNTGHFSFSAANTRTGNNIDIDEPTHPLADGVVGWVSLSGTCSFTTSETTVVASDQVSGEPVVIHKAIGVGHLVVMGIDYYDPLATEANEILGNAIRLYQPPSAPVLADPGATISGFQVPLNWTAATDADGVIIEYEIQASADAGFAIIGQSATVATLNHTFIFLTNDTYYFRVRAIDNNTLVGPWSNVVSTYIELPPITLPPGIPGFPIEAIALGLILSLGAIFVLRRRKQQQVSS
jgi:hypothetical protein